MNEENAPVLSEHEEGRAEELEVGSAHPMATLLQETDSLGALKKRQILEGTIVYISSDEILIDVGAKSEGIVTARDLGRLDPEFLAQLQVGDQVLAYVIAPEDKNGNILLSLAKAQVEKDWREAERLFKAQEIFEGTVAGYNKGGLIVRLGRVRGFVPASQLLAGEGEEGSAEERKAKLVGRAIQLKVIELDRERNRLILSERAAIRDWRRQRKDRLLEELNEGDIRTGVVSSLCDFGAFVDLGDADGLVHLSEISWRRVTHPSEVLKPGQEVEVYVLNVDRERKRIGLSLKRLVPDPWSLIDEQYEADQLVEGTITKLVKFGAFARLSDTDIEGLIHVSELADEHISHPKEVVKEGDVLTLRIIKIDTARRRMGLSLKRVASEDYVEQDWASGFVEEESAITEEGLAAEEGTIIEEEPAAEESTITEEEPAAEESATTEAELAAAEIELPEVEPAISATPESVEVEAVEAISE